MALNRNGHIPREELRGIIVSIIRIRPDIGPTEIYLDPELPEGVSYNRIRTLAAALHEEGVFSRRRYTERISYSLRS